MAQATLESQTQDNQTQVSIGKANIYDDDYLIINDFPTNIHKTKLMKKGFAHNVQTRRGALSAEQAHLAVFDGKIRFPT